MMKGDHGPTKLLHVLTWGAFDHASHASQLWAYKLLCVCVCMCECEYTCVCMNTCMVFNVLVNMYSVCV